MLRILSALVLIPAVLGAIWFLPPLGLLVVAEGVLWLAFFEYVRLAATIGVRVPIVVPGLAAAGVCAAVAWPGGSADPVLMAAVIVVGALALATARVGVDVLAMVVTSLFAALYLGLALGALVAVRWLVSREALLLLLLTVIVSDTAQLYAGSLFGRHKLARVISPKKSVEGAIGGFVGGIAAILIVGRWWLPGLGTPWYIGLGVVIVAAGILGDLFESQMKRSAGVKDSSALIPGHGGVLDRIDAILFAAPAYYLFLRYGM